MLELSLHLLDVIENAMRAKASIIRVSALRKNQFLVLSVEDDGPGLPVTPEQALDPFYTTKKGKRTGLGLSLFQSAALQAGGSFEISLSELGGVAVTAGFEYDHWDRAPLGDFVGTLKTVAMSAPNIVWVCHIEGNGAIFDLIFQNYLEEQENNIVEAVHAFSKDISGALDNAGICC